MSDRYSFLAVREDFQLVLGWFAALPDDVTVEDPADRVVYYFRQLAKVQLEAGADPNKTPLVIVTKPRQVRGSLWTDAEVWFSPTPFKRQFPALYRTSKSFSAWLAGYGLVFSQGSNGPRDWAYYLEGGIQNSNSELFALPQAMEALRAGQYFVHHRDNLGRLDMVAQTLRLRGYDVTDA